jgi:integrase
MEAYQAALGDTPVKPGIKTVPGSMGALVRSYLVSPNFMALSLNERRHRNSILGRFNSAHGHRSVTQFQPVHVKAMLAGLANPYAAKNFLVTIRGMMTYAVEIGMTEKDPTAGIKRNKIPKSDGYITWSEDHVAAFEAKHPVGSKARLALALLLYTGQRRGDVVRMGRQHIRNGAIEVRQEKTGAKLVLPLHSSLQAILAATPSEHLTLLTTPYGKPYTSPGFGNWFRKRCLEAGLIGLSAHGLRKAAARRLAEAGCTVKQIAAITGHTTLKEVARYTDAADQRRLAEQAIKAISGTTDCKTG